MLSDFYCKDATYTCLLCVCVTGVPDCSDQDLSVARALNLNWTSVLEDDENGMQMLKNSDEVAAPIKSIDYIADQVLNAKPQMNQ